MKADQPEMENPCRSIKILYSDCGTLDEKLLTIKVPAGKTFLIQAYPADRRKAWWIRVDNGETVGSHALLPHAPAAQAVIKSDMPRKYKLKRGGWFRNQLDDLTDRLGFSPAKPRRTVFYSVIEV